MCRRALHALVGLAHCGPDYAGVAAAALGQVWLIEARAAAVAGDPDAALDVLSTALAAAEARGDAAGRAHALGYQASVHVSCGRYDDAERLYEASRDQAVREGRRARRRHGAELQRIALVAASNLGIIAHVRGDLRRARSYYRRALVDARGIGAASEEVGILNNLGLLYAAQRRWDRAERAYREALDRAAGAHRDAPADDAACAQLHANLADVWLGRGDLPRARESVAAGVAASARTRDGAHRGELHKMAGVLAREAGALAEADAELAAAALAAAARQNLLLLAETLREQGELYRRQGRNRDTLAAFNRSHTLFRQLQARRELADVDRRVGRLEQEFLDVARRWGESIEAADRFTQGHCLRVADLACRIAEHAGPAHGFDAQALFWFRIGALLHDVGKLGVPADLLNKPGKLTDAEFALMRGHAEAGLRVLGDLEFPWDVRPLVLSHHERWDGRGYPHRLAGDAIPLAARVLAVADVYDALTSVRSYKRAMTHADACAIIRQDAGTAFDPQVVAWFEAVAPAWAAWRAAQANHAAGTPADRAPGPDDAATRRAAGLDEVTGLPGRDAFHAEGRRVLAARAEDGRPTTLLLLTFVPGLGDPGGPSGAGPSAVGGPGITDGALAAAAEAVARHTRGGDFVGRYAARELVVLLPDTTAAEGEATLARLCAVAGTALRRTAPRAPVTVVGGASTAPTHGTTPDALLAAAAGRTGAHRGPAGTLRAA